ncbi:co-chaperone GroES [Patescibacteria group bacterium]|nr:co-chaperone GroES [Patescibacteria group bacterium]MBU1755268.1 co-chaperone GroES [Patescibacteria group bacterium]
MKPISIQPLADRVLVKPVEANEEKVHASGIILAPAGDKERPVQGTVVAIGPGKYEDGKLVPMNVKVGDTVLFAKYGYEEITHENEEYLMLSESSILAVVKN